MNRAHWQAIAEERLVAAQALLAAQQWSSAYYLAGYAVEFGLKSCILVHVANTGVIFKEKKFSEQCWSHNFEDLVNLADLKLVLKADSAVKPLLKRNWLVVSNWNETSQYEQQTQPDTEELFAAITNSANGVMPWIRLRW